MLAHVCLRVGERVVKRDGAVCLVRARGHELARSVGHGEVELPRLLRTPVKLLACRDACRASRRIRVRQAHRRGIRVVDLARLVRVGGAVDHGRGRERAIAVVGHRDRDGMRRRVVRVASATTLRLGELVGIRLAGVVLREHKAVGDEVHRGRLARVRRRGREDLALLGDAEKRGGLGRAHGAVGIDGPQRELELAGLHGVALERLFEREAARGAIVERGAIRVREVGGGAASRKRAARLVRGRAVDAGRIAGRALLGDAVAHARGKARELEALAVLERHLGPAMLVKRHVNVFGRRIGLAAREARGRERSRKRRAVGVREFHVKREVAVGVAAHDRL